MSIRSFCAIATFAGALIGVSEARADFLVLCPTGGFSAVWGHTGGFQITGPHAIGSFKELFIPDTRFLNCHMDADFNVSLAYANPGTCGGSVSMTARTAVFNRPELFQSRPQQAFASIQGQVCTLEADVDFVTISVEMTEACESLNSNLGWSCPDSARQVIPEFGGLVEEAPAD